METELLAWKHAFVPISCFPTQIPIVDDFDSVFVAVTLTPAGQTPKQQRDHFKQEVMGHSQEHQREESQGIETRVVRAFS